MAPAPWSLATGCHAVALCHCLFEDQARHHCHWSPRPPAYHPFSQKPSSASYSSRKPLQEVGLSLTSCRYPRPLLGKGLVLQAPLVPS